MLHPEVANGFIPLVKNLVSGVSVDFTAYAVKSQMKGYSSDKQTKNILVIPIQGTIMKNDYCGDMGMITFERIIQEATNDPSIGAIVLDIDSGGGQATYLDHVANALLEFRQNKPILTHISGMCCSAAYYIAAQSSEIYASSELDMIGSIGTVMFMDKPNPNSTAATIPFAVYATKSTAKNKIFHDALDGKITPMQQQLLDPYCESFINAVQTGRPQVDKSAFDGRAVFAPEAIDLALIDGIKRLDDVIAQAFNLIQ